MYSSSLGLTVKFFMQTILKVVMKLHFGILKRLMLHKIWIKLFPFNSPTLSLSLSLSIYIYIYIYIYQFSEMNYSVSILQKSFIFLTRIS